MKIEFVTGKGGVGKSIQAAALARAHSEKGHRVLLAELGDHSFYRDLFGLPVVDGTPRPSGFGFSVTLWSGQTCLREYALHLLKVKRLYELFFENPVSHALIQAAPALSELAILGKVTSGPPRNVGPKMPFDILVVDGFASGHFIALLMAPQSMAEIIKVGPMGAQSRSIFEVLKRSDICSYHIVTLPEELPLREAIELKKQIQDLVHIEPHMHVNKWMEDLEKDWKPDAADHPWSDDLRSKLKRQAEAVVMLGEDVHKIPFIFEVETKSILDKLSTSWLEILL